MGGHWIDIEGENYKTYDGSHLKAQETIRLSDKIRKHISKSLD